MNQKRRQEVIRDDKAMIENPDRWPNWARLPLKRRREIGQFPDLALIINDARTKGKYLLYENVNMFNFPKDQNTGEDVKPEELRADEILARGWEVD